MSDTVLTLSGDLTVNRAAELRRALVDALARAGNLTIVTDDAEEVDLAFLQLVCSAHRSAARQHKTLSLRGKSLNRIKGAADNLGFKREVGCSHDPGRTCLWLGGA